MTLLNHTIRYLSVSLIVVLTVWAGIFYYNMLDEVYDSIDDGLENYKMLIINRAIDDPAVLEKTSFNEGNYYVKEISSQEARHVKDVYRDSTIYTLNERDYEPVRVLSSAFRSGDKFYQLTVMSSMVEEDDLIEDLFYSIIWLYVSLLVVIVLIHQLIMRRLWRPFYWILGRLRQYRLGRDESVGQMNARVKEFDELKEAVDLLIKRSTSTYNQQKQFIENASHELQTPLAIGINKLELLAERMQNDEDLRSVSEVSEVLHRLVRLNKSLLQLSKIENSQFQEVTEVDFNKLIKTQLDDFGSLAEFRGVSFHLTENGQCGVRMNLDLAKVLLTNLIKNAITHNTESGNVSIEINQSSVIISNDGKAAYLDEKKLFKRFYKDESSVGTGLGLSIVKAIIDLYDFTIDYSYKNKKHFFTIMFQ